MDNQELITFISGLNIDKNIHPSEAYYLLKDKIYIVIEMQKNVFILDDNKLLHKDKYTHIKDIQELIKVTYNKTKINLNVFIRKEKINKILNEK